MLSVAKNLMLLEVKILHFVQDDKNGYFARGSYDMK
jgi:hypothetical protein